MKPFKTNKGAIANDNICVRDLEEATDNEIIDYKKSPQYYIVCIGVSTPLFFLVKISQFKFLVMTEKNIFVYKLFLWLNILDFSLFLCKNCNPS